MTCHLWKWFVKIDVLLAVYIIHVPYCKSCILHVNITSPCTTSSTWSLSGILINSTPCSSLCNISENNYHRHHLYAAIKIVAIIIRWSSVPRPSISLISIVSATSIFHQKLLIKMQINKPVILYINWFTSYNFTYRTKAESKWSLFPIHTLQTFKPWSSVL